MSHSLYLKATADEAIYGVLTRIASDLEAVEALLEDTVASSVNSVALLSRHILKAGGKRLRPAMLSLSARAIGADYPTERVVRHGAMLELVHMATLLHDDVVDKTEARRGQPTANLLYGNPGSVLSGDALLARGMQLLAIDGDLQMINIVTEMVVEMSEGAAMEALRRGDVHLTESEYFEIIRRKTAVFIACCCRIGALLGGADEATAQHLNRFGHHVGMAFQLRDDLLDYLGDPTRTGKPVGTDFRDGNATLPLIHALASSNHTTREYARSGFGSSASSDEIVAVIEAIRSSGGDAHAERLAEQHADRALDCIAHLHPSAYRDCLEIVARYAVCREA